MEVLLPAFIDGQLFRPGSSRLTDRLRLNAHRYQLTCYSGESQVLHRNVELALFRRQEQFEQPVESGFIFDG